MPEQRERFLEEIRHHWGGPVGIETISAGLSEPRDAIEDIIEPYLIQQGFIQRTPRGRILTRLGYDHLGLEPGPAARVAQATLAVCAAEHLRGQGLEGLAAYDLSETGLKTLVSTASVF